MLVNRLFIVILSFLDNTTDVQPSSTPGVSMATSMMVVECSSVPVATRPSDAHIRDANGSAAQMAFGAIYSLILAAISVTVIV